MKKQILSLALVLALCLGLSVPASAEVFPAEYTEFMLENTPYVRLGIQGEDIIGVGLEDVLTWNSKQVVYCIKPGCSIDVLPNLETGGKITYVMLIAIGHSEQVDYFRSGWENIPFEKATITFTKAEAPDGKTVDFSDPNKMYELIVNGEDADGNYFSHNAAYFRLAPEADGAFQPLSIENGVLKKYWGDGGHVDLPKSVTSIAPNAFQFQYDITSITIPDSVTSIGSGAFSSCTGLREVVIPDSVTELGRSAFAWCSSLERVVIGDGITEIPQGTFADCSNLKEVVFGKNVASIGDSVFAGCTGLASLTIPQSVEYIGFQAFRNCSSLAEINIPETTVVSNVHSVFDGCTLLDIPPKDMNGASGKIVGCPFYETDTAYVFDLLFLREDGSLHSFAESIGKNAWEYRKDQTPQDLFGGDLGEYGRKSFARLREESSTELILPEGVTTIVDLAGVSDYNSIERLVLPNSLQVIGDGSGYAFYNCTNLKEIVFPSPEHISPALKYQDWESELRDLPSLERVINCPKKEFNERIAANLRMEAAWKEIDLKTVLAPQSKRITDLSNQICAGCATDYEKAKAVFDWMTANIVYDYDYYYGFKKTVTIEPEDVLDSKLTICDGYAQLTQALLLAQNIPAVYVSGPANNNIADWEGHAWNMVYADGRWIYIDSTWGSPGNNDWFDVSLVSLSADHVAAGSHAPNYERTPFPADSAAAAPNRSTVLVNGEQVAFDAYTINQNNYFKLRDLAKVLSGTGKQFEVTWDGSNKAINMLSGKPYTAVGGELAQGDGANKTASINTATIYLDGQPIYLTAYTINQNNYFKLRDVGQAFDFDVTWDGANNTIVVDTNQSYTAD